MLLSLSVNGELAQTCDVYVAVAFVCSKVCAAIVVVFAALECYSVCCN